MSSAITSEGLLTNYPVAGVDNNSQGFRDNFSIIKTAIDTSHAELNALELKSVLKTVSNDLLGGTIANGKYEKFYGRSYSLTNLSGELDISLDLGIFYNIIISANTTITFTHWPTSPLYGCVRFRITAAQTVDIDLAISNFLVVGGSVLRSTDYLQSAINKDSYVVMEAWSSDGGITVFLNYIGRYDKP